ISNVLGATITNILDGTISSVLGATITAGSLSSAGTITNILDGTISSILGATITAGSLSSAGTITNILDGTISSVLGATITAGSLSSAGTITNILDGTISSILGATITGGTLASVTSISQKSFVEQTTANVQADSTSFTPLPAVTTSMLGVYSFFVYNQLGGSITTRVEVSADGTNYYVDTNGSTIAACQTDVVVPARFLKYTRLSYRSTLLAAPATISVIFNAQGT
ncbi:MAG: hypothetical protein IKE34_13375, partial [Paenibacillus sp.]|nr:hypothetical protein [Paenibacillus sp.]